MPLNIARFAFPWFKTFEILICDQPTGSWATGVYWTFFNDRFPGDRQVVYTLWNRQSRTYRGPVLAVPASAGRRFYDAWHARELTPRRLDGQWLELSTEIAPQRPGCIVVEP